MRSLKTLLLSGALALAASVSAMAAPIAAGSTLGWVGTYQAQNSSGVGVTLDNATQIDFAPAGGGTGSVSIFSATGSLAPLAGQGATTKDLVFSPFSAVTSFLTAVGFQLDLLTLAIDTQNANTLSLLGTTTLKYAGYDATPGTYSLSFQTAGAGGVSQYNFTFSANAAAVSVPEPAALALLGAGLLGLGLVRRRRARAAV